MKKFLFILSITALFSAWKMNTPTESYTISGKVIDENAQPLIGASVLIKGTNLGVVTDLDGTFSLASQTECAFLVISYTGFQTLENPNACSGKKLEFKLTQSAEQLMEVVVTSASKPKNRRAKESKKRERLFEMADQAMEMEQAPMAGVPIQTYAGKMHQKPDHQPNWNTEDYDRIYENRFFETQKNPLSTFSIDVDAASYSNMRRFLKNGQLPPKDAVRIEEMVNYFNYDYPQPDTEHPFQVITEISECPWQPEHQLVHIGLQGKNIPMDELPASNLVFLIDVSGSMEAANKLPLLQASFKLLTDQLRPKDKVALVVYAGAAGVVLPSTSGSNKQKIKDAIGQLQAGGSTAGGEGIKLAYNIARENFVKEGNNRVILATDGDFNIGASSDSEMERLIEKERESGVFLTVLGFGMGNYKDNKMQKLAATGNGNHAYIDDISEAKKVLVSEFGGTMFAIAKDVKLQLEFNPAKVAGYRLIGYENRILNHEDFNDDKKDAGELGSGHTVTAMYEIIPVGVKSSYLGKVDDLKYQSTKTERTATKTDELLTIKLRYKQPDGHASKLIEIPVLNAVAKKPSENFYWAAATAEFGMLLRESEYKGNATYSHLLELAKMGKGQDKNGYRQEMINMIETVRSLVDPVLAGKN